MNIQNVFLLIENAFTCTTLFIFLRSVIMVIVVVVVVILVCYGTVQLKLSSALL